MIPVLIAPIYNRMDLFHQMIESIDHEIGMLLVVDNRPGAETPLVLPPRLAPRQIQGVSSFGYGGSINLGIMQTSDAAWWMWASNDLVFEPGHLARVAAEMERNPNRVLTHGFTWGALGPHVVQTVGLVDELNFFPIYYDDNDYHYRCKLAGIEWLEMGGVTHAEGGSATIKGDPQTRAGNGVTFGQNKARYMAKWGGPPHGEIYETPWNEGHELSYQRFDFSIRQRAARAWPG